MQSQCRNGWNVKKISIFAKQKYDLQLLKLRHGCFELIDTLVQTQARCLQLCIKLHDLLTFLFGVGRYFISMYCIDDYSGYFDVPV
jgi:hypothetical protein